MDIFRDKLYSILERFEIVKEKLNNSTKFDQNESISLSKEFSNLNELASIIKLFFSKEKELSDLQELLDSSDDNEIKSIAESEYLDLKNEIQDIEYQIKIYVNKIHLLIIMLIHDKFSIIVNELYNTV